jgi:outer membrane protein OmpA-like peptidoglycan-associated protein
MSFVLPTSSVPVTAPTAYAPAAAAAPVTIVHPVAPVPRSSYANAQLSGMNFSNQNFAGTDFSNATLTQANFSGTDLTDANFSNANLSGAIFTDANLSGANLSNANLQAASLTNASLSHANLTNASLKRAVITNASFDAAILTNADMGSAIRQSVMRPVPPPVAPLPMAATAPAMRPAFIDAGAISSALKIDPAQPTMTPRKIDLTVNFDVNADRLTGDSAKQIHEIARALNDPSLQKAHIMIEGHTDNSGSDAYNQELSFHLATSVLRSLIEEYGIPAARLSAEGFGKTRPVTSSTSELGHALNRRVTLVNLGN